MFRCYALPRRMHVTEDTHVPMRVVICWCSERPALIACQRPPKMGARAPSASEMPSCITSAVGLQWVRGYGSGSGCAFDECRSPTVPAPMMQSPPMPTCARSSTSAGRSAIIVIPVSRPRRSSPWTQRRRRDVAVLPDGSQRSADHRSPGRSTRYAEPLGLAREPHPQLVAICSGLRRLPNSSAHHRAARHPPSAASATTGCARRRALCRRRQVAAATVSVAAKLS